MPKNNITTDIVKRPYQGPADYSERQLLELISCFDNPLYFMENFMKVQHPIKGSMPFEPYDFQKKLIYAFHKNRFVVGCTARQLGKCSTFDTLITVDGKEKSIGSLIKNKSIKFKVVNLLEKFLIFIGKKL